MHIAPDGLDKPEDLALLRSVLRGGGRSAGPAEAAQPTRDDRFGPAPGAPGGRDARARAGRAPRTIAAGS